MTSALCLLAQIESVPAVDLKSWILVALGVLAAVSLVKTTFFGGTTRITGGEIDVRDRPQWVTKQEFTAFQSAVEGRLEKIREDMAVMQNGRISDLTELRKELEIPGATVATNGTWTLKGYSNDGGAASLEGIARGAAEGAAKGAK